jgi:hypothetical protein
MFSVLRFSRPLLILAGTTVAVLASAVAQAHHGITTKFDPEQTATFEGRVSRVDWANPHVHLFLQVDDNGQELPWYVELESPKILELNGWTEDTVQPGQLLKIEGPRARDGSRQVWGSSVQLDGKAVMTTDKFPTLLSSLPKNVKAVETPRGADGKPLLGAPKGDSGYWIPTVTTLQEDGANVAMAANGQLENIADAGKVAPLQDWAQKLYTFRQENHLNSDPTYLSCRPPAGPRKFLDPFGIQLLEDKPLDRIFVIAGGGNHDWHLIYTDGRELDSDAFELDAGNQLYYGRNTAHWEGDTLVIESEGYNEKFWLPGGLPHSDMMHATERLTRVDYDTMNYQLTINDPGTYTRPWTASWTLKWLDGADPAEHYCQDNRL